MKANITDRAKRYRAQQNVTGPKKCVICGSRQNLGVMHLTGNENPGETKNLAWGCKSCNGILGSAFKKFGLGKPTNQYNPAKGVPSFEQYAAAVGGMLGGEREYYPNSTRHKKGAHDEAGAIIHATPKSKRVEYAIRIAREAGRTRKQKHEDRWNPASNYVVHAVDVWGKHHDFEVSAESPADARRGAVGSMPPDWKITKVSAARRNPAAGSAEAFERFHGRRSGENIDIEESIHVHEHLAALGTLKQLKVKSADGGIVTVSGFGKALLCGDEGDSQLFVRGGDQSLDLDDFGIEEPYRELEDLGEVRQIRYHTVKNHLGKDGGDAVYFHNFGEDDKAAGRRPRRPRLLYSVRDSLISFAGGGYTITPEGIRN